MQQNKYMSQNYKVGPKTILINGALHRAHINGRKIDGFNWGEISPYLYLDVASKVGSMVSTWVIPSLKLT